MASATIKYAIGIISILYFAQFVELVRMRRDDGLPDIAGALNNMLDKLKGSLDQETIDQILNTAKTVVSDGSKMVKNQLQDITTKIGN